MSYRPIGSDIVFDSESGENIQYYGITKSRRAILWTLGIVAGLGYIGLVMLISMYITHTPCAINSKPVFVITDPGIPRLRLTQHIGEYQLESHDGASVHWAMENPKTITIPDTDVYLINYYTNVIQVMVELKDIHKRNNTKRMVSDEAQDDPVCPNSVTTDYGYCIYNVTATTCGLSMQVAWWIPTSVLSLWANT